MTKFLFQGRALLTLLGVCAFAPAHAAAPSALESSTDMVVTAQHLGADVGAAILAKGGNAIDAAVAIGYVIYKNLIPVPAAPYNVLPYVFAGLIAVGLAWYAYLWVNRRDVARRVGTIQTLSEAEQDRLAELGLLAAARPSEG